MARDAKIERYSLGMDNALVKYNRAANGAVRRAWENIKSSLLPALLKLRVFVVCDP